ncbi:NAD(P)-dependent alcohol dehydrogenase [Actinomadura welshii]
MKAIINDRYGPPGDLRLRDIDRPEPSAGEVLVRVHAAALHVGDCFKVRGVPFLVRAASGLRRPRYGVPGEDLAGLVEAVGDGVTRFRPGDEVFGFGGGSCAEYALAKEDRLAPKPAGLSFEEAAAMPTSAVTALRGLRDTGRVEPGQRVLINGASGGVGTFAVQIAVSLGAEVTGVCGPANADMVRSIGARHVIDHTREDFTRGTRRYDVILDNVENHSLSGVRRALAPDGTLLPNSGTGASGARLLFRQVKPVLVSPFVRQRLRRFVAVPKPGDLAAVAELAENGSLKPVIGRTYPLPRTAEALDHIETGHAGGKTLITF